MKKWADSKDKTESYVFRIQWIFDGMMWTIRERLLEKPRYDLQAKYS